MAPLKITLPVTFAALKNLICLMKNGHVFTVHPCIPTVYEIGSAAFAGFYFICPANIGQMY